jgi:glycosyltransferase involved in cell wall biosynthesis
VEREPSVTASPTNPAVPAISAFFPCYNDQATIGSLVETVSATLDKLGVDGEVIVVNDGSSDESDRVLKVLSETEPKLRIVTHAQNQGYGAALLSGFAAATKEWVFYTDGDGQYDPAELVALVEQASDGVDIVQGYKLNRADNVFRLVIGRLYHRFVALFFGLKVRDTDCDFRLIRRSKLREVHLQHTTGVICVELMRRLQDADARFVEAGVHHYPRRHGKSQFFRLLPIVRALMGLGKLWVEVTVRDRRRGRRAGN